jgi:dihydroflavonol-4-reductase
VNIAVLGATGMIGRHTAQAVIDAGHALTVIHRKSSNLVDLQALRFESSIADLEDPDAMADAFSRVDAVIHCAGYYPTVPRPLAQELAQATAQMENFLNACARARNLEKVVYVGAAIALPRSPDGTPGTEALDYTTRPADPTPYVQVKFAMDRMARARAKDGVPVTVGIPAMTFGEYDRGPTTGQLVVDVANRALPAYIEGRRNVIYAGDAGRGLVAVCEKGAPGERYLLTGTDITVSELVRKIASIAGVEPPRRALPLPIARLVCWAGETKYRLFGGKPPKLSSTALAVIASGQFLDGAKAREALGFEACIDLDETLARTLRWFREAGYIHGRGGQG